MEDYLAVGKIVNTHGLRGEMKVLPLTSDILRFDYLKLVWVEAEGKLTEYFVEKARCNKQFVLLTLRGIETKEHAAQFKNCLLKVDRKHARTLEEDEYFIVDLIRCEVYEKGVKLGVVTDVLQPGGNDVYVVQNEQKDEILIPAIASVVERIDIENKKIDVILPEGLVDNDDF